MPEPSSYTVVRELLTENFKLSNDEVITHARTRGVTKLASDLRRIINHTRSDLRKRKNQKKPAPSTDPSVYTLARAILTAEPTLSIDDVLARVKARGSTKSDSYIREAVRRTRNDVQRKGPKPVLAAARTTVEPKPIPQPVSAPGDESALFASIAQANKTAHLCGGVAKAREIAEAIRASGGIDAFLKRLELVAEIIGSGTEM